MVVNLVCCYVDLSGCEPDMLVRYAQFCISGGQYGMLSSVYAGSEFQKEKKTSDIQNTR